METHIGDIIIGEGRPPLIVAELSGNHLGELDKALELVTKAREAGADAVKIQTYTPDTMTLDVDKPPFKVDLPGSPWHGKKLYDIYAKAHTPREWHKTIFAHCQSIGLICFSTAYDPVGLQFLESLDVEMPAYKIASPEVIDIPLIKAAAATGKPLIVSTGMANLEEMRDCVDAAKNAGAKDVVMLKCVTAYPSEPAEANLATMADMRRTLQCPIGYSDHTTGVGVAIAAAALGAVLIEKHLKLSDDDQGTDSFFSINPEEFKIMVNEARRAWHAIGTVHYGPVEGEKPYLRGRPSLYIVEDLKKGDVLSEDNVKSIRPAGGLPPKHLDQIIGKTLNQDADKGTPVSWELIDQSLRIISSKPLEVRKIKKFSREELHERN